MERLTAKKDGHVYVINCPPCKVPHDVNVILQQTADRLAAYEDTGLEPAEIKSLQAEWAVNLRALDAYRALGSVDRLRELAQADREGRCVVLPVQVGQNVYFVNRAFDSEICTAIVIGAEINLYTPSCPIWLRIEWFSARTGKHEYHSRADLMIGITVFLTREEADAALRREQDD